MSESAKQILFRNVEGIVRQKHRAFAMNYLLYYDVGRAYRECVTFDKDGNEVSDEMCMKLGQRLLKTVFVQQIIDEETCRLLEEKRNEKRLIVARLNRVYLEAMAQKDLQAANSALDKLMKHFGMYNEHNRQKKYSPDDIAAIRAKLEAHGVNLTPPGMPVLPAVSDDDNPYTLPPSNSGQDVQDAEIVPPNDKEKPCT